MARPQIVVTDRAGVQVGEVYNAKARSLSVRLNGTRTISFSIRRDNPIASDIIGVSGSDRINRLLKVYRDGDLEMVGPVIGAQVKAAAEGATLAVSGADPLWLLGHRLIGKNLTGTEADPFSARKPIPFADGTPTAMKDLGQIASDIINQVNGEGDSGVRIGSINPSSNSYVGPWYTKKAAEAIMEMANTLGGYDFELVPEEPTADGFGVKLATFNTYGSMGTNRPGVIFEYGTGKNNVADYEWAIDAAGLMNKGYSLAQGFPDSVDKNDLAITWGSNASSMAARGLHEDVVPGDLTVLDLRQKLVDEHVSIRRVPRETIVFAPTVEAQFSFGQDYYLGDTITGRILEAGELVLNGLVRVYGMDFEWDDQDNETAKPVLIPEL